MPKKTRKQKVAAEIRNAKILSAHAFTFTASPARVLPTVENSVSYQKNATDIRKTILLGALFVGLELLLYFGAPRLGW